MTWFGFYDKEWCNYGCGTRPNLNKAWSKGQCGSIAINYGKFVIKDELKNSYARSYYCLKEHTYQ
jgi:hypothetical protein